MAKFRTRDDYEFEARDRAGGWRRAAERVESAERAEARMTGDRVEPEFFASSTDRDLISVDPETFDDGDQFLQRRRPRGSARSELPFADGRGAASMARRRARRRARASSAKHRPR